MEPTELVILSSPLSFTAVNSLVSSFFTFPLHHRRYFPPYLRPSVPNRTAQTADISIGHRCCLMPEQVLQDVHSNARCCCLGHNRAPQIVQFHTFNSSVCDNLYEMLPHGAIDGARFAVVGKDPLASVEARKLYQKV